MFACCARDSCCDGVLLDSFSLTSHARRLGYSLPNSFLSHAFTCFWALAGAETGNSGVSGCNSSSFGLLRASYTGQISVQFRDDKGLGLRVGVAEHEGCYGTRHKSSE